MILKHFEEEALVRLFFGLSCKEASDIIASSKHNNAMAYYATGYLFWKKGTAKRAY